MTRFETNRSANCRPGGAGRPLAETGGPRPTHLEIRLLLLEEAYRELGARLAALEGIVFSLQQRLRDPEESVPAADPRPPFDSPDHDRHQPHQPARPFVWNEFGNP